MNDLNVWIFAVKIVELSVVAMVGVYVVLSVGGFNSKRNLAVKEAKYIGDLITKGWNDKKVIKVAIEKLQDHERNLEDNSIKSPNKENSAVEIEKE